MAVQGAAIPRVDWSPTRRPAAARFSSYYSTMTLTFWSVTVDRYGRCFLDYGYRAVS